MTSAFSTKKFCIPASHARRLHRLRKIPKSRFHPLQHRIHCSHNISKRTIFYMKEYGPRTNVSWTIIRESIRILVMASLISSLGGLALESIKPLIVALVPIIILLPVLNDMIGDYGAIISSKFSTMLHEGKVSSRNILSAELAKLLSQIMVIASVTSLAGALVALAISGYNDVWLSLKIIAIAMTDVLMLVGIISAVAVAAGIYFFRKGEDPSNFLIPITTSLADFGNMFLLAVIVLLFF